MAIYFFLCLVTGQLQEIQEFQSLQADEILARNIVAHPLWSILICLGFTGVILWALWFLKRALDKMKDIEVVTKSKDRPAKEKERLIELYNKEYI
jgi:spore coat polysaccharide biosynthesis predicted glycosyltransferase SpsG